MVEFKGAVQRKENGALREQTGYGSRGGIMISGIDWDVSVCKMKTTPIPQYNAFYSQVHSGLRELESTDSNKSFN